MFTLLRFHKTSKRASTLSNFYNVLSFVHLFFLFLSLSLLLLSLFCLHQQATRCNRYRAHSTTYLSIIFTVEGILIGAQLRRIDGWQVHRHWFGRQEGHRLRSHILRRYQLTLSLENDALVREHWRKCDDVIALFIIVVIRSLTGKGDQSRAKRIDCSIDFQRF